MLGKIAKPRSLSYWRKRDVKCTKSKKKVSLASNHPFTNQSFPSILTHLSSMSSKGAKAAPAPAPAAAKPAAPAVDPKVQAARDKLRAKYGDQAVCSFFIIF